MAGISFGCVFSINSERGWPWLTVAAAISRCEVTRTQHASRVGTQFGLVTLESVCSTAIPITVWIRYALLTTPPLAVDLSLLLL